MNERPIIDRLEWHAWAAACVFCVIFFGSASAQSAITHTVLEDDNNDDDQMGVLPKVAPNVIISVNPPHPSIAWSGFRDALSRADKTAVLHYFSNPEKYDAVFEAMGSNMKLLALSMSGFDFIELTSNYATAVVNLAEPSGRASQHYVTFTFKDGRWQIMDF